MMLISNIAISKFIQIDRPDYAETQEITNKDGYVCTLFCSTKFS